MSINEALRWGQKQLNRSRTAALDTRVLLANTLDCSITEVLSSPRKKLSADAQKKFRSSIGKRKRGIPVAYLMNEKEFYGITLEVNHDVLVPRPTTEAVVAAAVKDAKSLNPEIIYEVGTGSGAIAVALAKRLPKVKIIASDISSRALLVAGRNIRRHKLNRRIKLVKSNLGEHIKKSSLVVANLPYLPLSLRKKEGLKFEPPKALFAGKTGLELYQKMFTDLLFAIAVIELGARQYPSMSKWLKQKFPRANIIPVRDLDGTVCGLRIVKDR